MNLRRTIKNIFLPLFLTGRLFAGDNQSIRSAVYDEETGKAATILSIDLRSRLPKATKKVSNSSEEEAPIIILGSKKKIRIEDFTNAVQLQRRVRSAFGIYNKADFKVALQEERRRSASNESQTWTRAANRLIIDNHGGLVSIKNNIATFDNVEPGQRIFVLPIGGQEVLFVQFESSDPLVNKVLKDEGHATQAKGIIIKILESLLEEGGLLCGGMKIRTNSTPFSALKFFKEDMGMKQENTTESDDNGATWNHG